jgi:uncharacterized membrane protein
MLISDGIRRYLGWCPNARAFTQHQQMDATGFPVSVTESEKPPSTGLFGKQNAEKYRHTQVGIVLTSCLIIGILGSIFDFFTNGIFGLRIVGIPFFLFMAGLLLTSTTLTVIIVDNRIELFLGPLPLRKRTIPLSEIMSVRVENDARHTVRKANWYLLP